MNRNETKNVKIGDILEITHAGRNYGKQGIVRELCVNRRQGLFIEPLNCKFEFGDKGSERRHTVGDGLYIFPYENLNYPKKPSNKIFYINRMFGEDGIEWPTENFTEKELKVINRFLEEFNEHAGGLSIGCVAILDNDDEEDED